MTTNITITETRGARARAGMPTADSSEEVCAAASVPLAAHVAAHAAASTSRKRKLPGWLWFAMLWCGGVAAAMSLGFAFKLLMNATLFAVK
ncbi:hypothetical protein [Paraburkholderia antibiotica]|uniref:DUF2474 domain-containing protein n=1 Tax=Paraburkholderia antibiotica TaxID=2728839 RepID=A0A7Y0FFC1_9BURK|nr:hypothetical protein [Paraburkholderia antibiotica]NML34083.1 hypothetical protein [Paraburkholderia antibiotica]